MADLALRLKVFVASPGDLTSERDIVERIVGAAARDYERHRLLLQCFRWEDGATPGYERPQARINRHLRTAELTVVMFWTRLGSAASVNDGETGSLEELRIAGEQVVAGASDDVFVYFKTASAPEHVDATNLEAVRRLRAQLDGSKGVFVGEFQTQLEFEERFARHLKLWLERWIGLPEICEFALDQSGGKAAPEQLLADWRMSAVLYRLDLTHVRDAAEVLGDVAVRVYQREGPVAWVRPLPDEVVSRLRRSPCGLDALLPDSVDSGAPVGELAQSPLVQANSSFHFADEEWFFFFCAVGLVRAIVAREVEAVARHPYMNPVHQFLKGLSVEWQVRDKLAPVLRDWLSNVAECTKNRPVARNFAAYVLGMLGVYDAHEDLARAIQTDSGRDVRRYCVTSLGKLRARPQLQVLKDLYGRESSEEMRLTIAQAICRMVGIADYEM